MDSKELEHISTRSTSPDRFKNGCQSSVVALILHQML